jgi:hypothetical protein
MGLWEATRILLAPVEPATGCRVVVTQDLNLRTIFSVLAASPDRSGHVIGAH